MTIGVSGAAGSNPSIYPASTHTEANQSTESPSSAFQELIDKHLDEIARSQVAFAQYKLQGRSDLAQGAHHWAQKQREALVALGVPTELYQPGVDLSARFHEKHPTVEATVYDPSQNGRAVRTDYQHWLGKLNQAYATLAPLPVQQDVQPSPTPSVVAPAVQPAKPQPVKTGPLQAAPPKVKDYIVKAAKEVDIDPQLLAAIAHNESGFKLSARSSKGAVGLFQLMPSTAKELGVNPHDPYQNVLGGAKYIKDKMDKYDGDLRLALAAYNAGPGNVDRAIKKAGNVKTWEAVQAFLPRETQRFVPKVLGTYV
ncbi:lytic transglycosylase domain-containing protein [Ammoniphilus sp. YIM 78166]|uniref:lytic transglycosylase domain-containing protein n=1 Tax=Ammoniphilus sp. YIM 78166 TaxID=1644106 RepID=UPI00106F4ED8|nr:lytic transglycosylase domain-containing protein [Ammoniphilus sp. YIM 78166]